MPYAVFDEPQVCNLVLQPDLLDVCFCTIVLPFKILPAKQNMLLLEP